MSGFARSKIDWLVFAEKGTQAEDIVKALFDKGQPTGDVKNGGKGGTNISSVLSGTVVVARAQGHLFEMLYPQEQDARYNRQSAPEVDEFGFEVRSAGYRSDEDMLSEYPVKLDLNHIKYDYRLNARSKTVRSNARNLSKNLASLYKKAERVIVATDSDSEGEMIFRNWLQNEMHVTTLPKAKLYRVLITNLDNVSIRQAFKTTLQRYDQMSGKLGKAYQALAPQGFSRAVSDYEFGMSYALYGRVVAEKMGVSGQIPTRVWGRLKNTILGHVRHAELAHDNFKPSSKYRIDLKSQNGILVRGSDSLVFDTLDKANQFIAEHDLPTTVDLQAVSSTARDVPPQMFNRTKLLVAADKLPISNNDWGAVLQSDYETHKILAYPRSDSRHLTEEVFKTLQNSYFKNTVVQELLDARIQEMSAKVTDGSAKVQAFVQRPMDKRWVDDSKAVPHYAVAINPDNAPSKQVLAALNPAEKALFLVDLYQTMALFMSDTINEKAIFNIGVQNDGKFLFSQTYNTTIEQGWRLLTGELKQGDQQPQVGSQSVSYVVSEVKAKRPPLLTASSLLDLLTNRDEGTSATRDKTIDEMIKARGLIRDQKALRITPELGPVVDNLLQRKWIDMDQTASWQKALNAVSSEDEGSQFIENVRSDTRDLQKQIMQTYGIEKY